MGGNSGLDQRETQMREIFLLRKIFTSKQRDHVVAAVLVIVLGLIFWRLFDTHIIKPDNYGNLTTGESTYGDLPFHLSTISQIVYGKIFPPENPFYAGLQQTYPYFINVLSVPLVEFGVTQRNSIIWPGMFFSLIMVWAIFFFYIKISGNRKVAFWGTLLFFLNGGAGFYYFVRDVVSKNLINNFLSNPTNYPDYTHVFGENIQWPNFVSRIIVPERSVLLGIPMGILILYLLFLRSKQKKVINVGLVTAAVLTGLLPFSHTHTFLVFALVVPFLAFFELKKNNWRSWLLRWVIYGITTLTIASPQLYEIITHIGGSESFFRFRIGWMAKPGFVELVAFWFKNTLFLIPIMVYALLLKTTPVILKRLLTISFVIFIMVNLFIFQPYDWDNVKFLFWFGIFGYLAYSFVLVYLWNRKLFQFRIVAVLLFLISVISAIPSIYRELNVSYQLFSKEDTALGQWVKNNTDRNSIFLTAPIHNSFVNNLGGRRIFMGYQGLLWVHGIPYGQREQEVKSIYSGSSNSISLLKENNISYVVVGPSEKNDLMTDIDFFTKNFCLVKKSENYQIFSVYKNNYLPCLLK